MGRKRYKPAEIVGKLRQAEVLHCRACRWPRQSGNWGSALMDDWAEYLGGGAED